MPWENSDRRARLPRDWPRLRLRILRRDGYRCQIRNASGAPCLAPAREVDHIIPGDDHSMTNLQAACPPCHARKTIAERPKPPSRRRPPEPHPGLL